MNRSPCFLPCKGIILFRIMYAFKPFFKFRDRKGLVKIEALCHLAVVGGQKIDLPGSFDSLCDTLQSQLLRHGNDMPEHHTSPGQSGFICLRQEALVHLQHIPRDLLDELQRRIPDAEIKQAMSCPTLSQGISDQPRSQARWLSAYRGLFAGGCAPELWSLHTHCCKHHLKINKKFKRCLLRFLYRSAIMKMD